MSKNETKISLDCPFKDFLYYYLASHSSVRAWIRIRIRICIVIFSWIHIRIFSMRIRNTTQKLLLTDRMKKKTLDFARPTRTGPLSRVIYSDKSTFRCIRAIRARVQSPHGSSDFSHYNVKTVRHSDKVMVLCSFHEQSEQMHFSSSKKHYYE